MGNKVRGDQAGSLYLVDAELPLEAAAYPIVQRDLHRVVNVPHFVPAHLILDVEPDHCRRQGEKSHKHPEKRDQSPPLGTPHSSTSWTGRAPGHPGAHSLGPRATEKGSASRGGGESDGWTESE